MSNLTAEDVFALSTKERHRVLSGDRLLREQIRDRIKSLRAGGASLSSIAKQCSIAISTVSRHLNGGHNRIRKEVSSLVRMWGGAKVSEAKKPLRIFLLPKDVEGAVQGDPANCAFARAARRSCGSKRAIFLRGTAYVELMQDDGTVRVERFMMPKTLRAMIEQFDKTGEAPPGGFVLEPPKPSDTLEIQRARQKAYVSRQSLIKGSSRKGSYAEPLEIRVNGVRQKDGVRYGTGMVHFIEQHADSSLTKNPSLEFMTS